MLYLKILFGVCHQLVQDLLVSKTFLYCFCLFYFLSLVLPCNTLLLGTLIAAGLDRQAFVKKHRKKPYLNSSYLPKQSLGREVN